MNIVGALEEKISPHHWDIKILRYLIDFVHEVKGCCIGNWGDAGDGDVKKSVLNREHFWMIK